MITLNNNNLKLKNIFIQEFSSIDDFNKFKKDNRQCIVHDIKFISLNNSAVEYKILLIYQQMINHEK